MQKQEGKNFRPGMATGRGKAQRSILGSMAPPLTESNLGSKELYRWQDRDKVYDFSTHTNLPPFGSSLPIDEPLAAVSRQEPDLRPSARPPLSTGKLVVQEWQIAPSGRLDIVFFVSTDHPAAGPREPAVRPGRT